MSSVVQMMLALAVSAVFAVLGWTQQTEQPVAFLPHLGLKSGLPCACSLTAGARVRQCGHGLRLEHSLIPWVLRWQGSLSLLCGLIQVWLLLTEKRLYAPACGNLFGRFKVNTRRKSSQPLSVQWMQYECIGNLCFHYLLCLDLIISASELFAFSLFTKFLLLFLFHFHWAFYFPVSAFHHPFCKGHTCSFGSMNNF